MILGFAMLSILLVNDCNLTTSIYIYYLAIIYTTKTLVNLHFSIFQDAFWIDRTQKLDRSSPWTVVLSVELNK